VKYSFHPEALREYQDAIAYYAGILETSSGGLRDDPVSYAAFFEKQYPWQETTLCENVHRDYPG
jgi:hypothetical protein